MARNLLIFCLFLLSSASKLVESRSPLWRRVDPYAKTCPEPPSIEGGIAKSVSFQSYMGDMGSMVGVRRTIYQCDNGKAPIGNAVSVCRVGLGEASDGTWFPIPTCPSDEPARNVKGAPRPESPCVDLEQVDDSSCNPSEMKPQWRYRKAPNTCREVINACPGTPWQNSFSSQTKCLKTCVKTKAPQSFLADYFEGEALIATEPPTTTQAPKPTQGGQMTGGLNGPNCIDGVSPPHTSCLDNSPNCNKTESFYISEALDEHNKIRQRYAEDAVSMPMLKWDKMLAITAERWAAQCPEWHDSDEARKHPKWPYVGQNICWSSGRKWPWSECIKNWAEEAKDWQYGVGALSSNAVIGHFTQLVWAKTVSVGCGRAKCKGNWEYVMVCNYGPGGNSVGYGEDPYAKPYERRN